MSPAIGLALVGVIFILIALAIGVNSPRQSISDIAGTFMQLGLGALCMAAGVVIGRATA